MKQLIKKYYQEYINLSKKINPSIIASSLVYYFIIIVIPLINYINYLLYKLEITNIEYEDGYFKLSGLSLMIFFVNLIYVSSKIIYNLKKTLNIIYQKENTNIFIITRIKSIIIMIILIVLIISLIIGELYIHYLFKEYITAYKVISNLILVILRFLMISLTLGFLLKQVIPVKVKLKETFKISLVVTFISYILIRCYYYFYLYFGTIKYQNLYGSLYQIFLLLVLIYLLFLVAIYAIIFEYIRYKINNNEYTKYEHERGV